MKTQLEDRLTRIKMLLIAGKTEQAQELLEKLLVVEPDAAEALMLAAELDLRSGLHERAEERLQRALDSVQDKGRLWFDLGNAALVAGNTAQALERFKHAESQGFEQFKLLLNTAVCHELNGEFEAALHCYESAHAIDKDDFEANNLLAGLLLKMGRLREAAESAQLLAERHRERIEGTHILVAISLLLNRPTEAKELLDATGDRFGNNLLYQYDYVRVLEQLEEYQQAYDRLMGVDETQMANHLSFRKLKSRVLISLSRIEEAKKEIETICGEVADIEAEYILAMLVYAEKDFSRAADLFGRIAAYNDNSKAYYTSLLMRASALQQMGNEKQARAEYEAAYEVFREGGSEDPASAYLYLLRSYCCKELGRLSEAQELLDFVEHLDADETRLEEYRSELKELIETK